jgi:hypothetical protein
MVQAMESGIVVDVVPALDTIDSGLAGVAVNIYLAWPKTYDMDTVLIPAVVKLSGPARAATTAVARLRAACVAHLRVLHSRPISNAAKLRRRVPAGAHSPPNSPPSIEQHSATSCLKGQRRRRLAARRSCDRTQLVRKGEELWIAAMLRDPILIERPIIAGGRAGRGRSPENVKKPAALGASRCCLPVSSACK